MKRPIIPFGAVVFAGLLAFFGGLSLLYMGAVHAQQPGYTIGQQPKAVWNSEATAMFRLTNSTAPVIPFRILGNGTEVLRIDKRGQYFVRGKPASDEEAAVALREWAMRYPQ